MQGEGVSYLVAAYAVVWAALFIYLGFIVMRIRGVRTELAAVEELVHEHEREQDRKAQTEKK
jgi:CcmD family protein